MSATNGCAAVVVTYFPDSDRLLECVHAVTPQVEHIFVVDNTPAPNTLGNELRAILHSERITLIINGENAGLAAGLNRGIELALASGLDYVLLLDQDSVPNADMVAMLIDAITRSTEVGTKLAGVGASYEDSRSGVAGYFVQIKWWGLKRMRCETRSSALVPVDFLITSGTLIPATALTTLGAMEEGLFVDHVDTEWCLRARAAGWGLFGACGAKLSHRLGERAHKIWLGRWRHVPRHNIERYYYMLRNGLSLQCRPYVPFAFKVTNVTRMLKLALLALITSGSPVRACKLMVRAGIDAINGRNGRLIE